MHIFAADIKTTVDKITFCNKEEAIARMNRWAGEGTPFFFMISYYGNQCVVEKPEDVCADELLYQFPAATNVRIGDDGEVSRKPFSWQPHPESYEEYKESFDVVHRNLMGGNSFLANLTCATPVDTDLTLKDIFFRSKARYKVWLKDRFVVFSPEIFVRIDNGWIYSFPMKGTLDATLSNATEQLLTDPKETAEHATITDLIRNDLSRVASEVEVARYRYIETLHTHSGPLLQMSSEIKGLLDEGYQNNLGELFFSMLPAGSITGAPKKRTVEIIAEAEHYERGFYTGVTGYFDGRNLDSAVMIRFVERTDDGNMIFKSGGGITFQSDAVSEYQEMIQKVYVPIY